MLHCVNDESRDGGKGPRRVVQAVRQRDERMGSFEALARWHGAGQCRARRGDDGAGTRAITSPLHPGKLCRDQLRGARRGDAAGVRPDATRGGHHRGGQGDGRLPVPDRHDAAQRDRPRGRAVRLGRRHRGQPCQAVARPAVPAGLRDRCGDDDVPLERCDCRRPDPCGLCGRAQGEGRAAAASVRLRPDRERCEFRAADFEPGQSGAVRRQDASARSVVRLLRHSIDRVDCGHIRPAASRRAQSVVGPMRMRCRSRSDDGRRQGGAGGASSRQ